jgi:rhomboid protease GluP
MIDLNHILLFIACVSPLVMLAQTFRRGGLLRAWRMAAFSVLLVTGVAWFVAPDAAGFVGGGAWLALVFIPAVGLKHVAELASRQRYASARRWTAILRFLHPAAALRAQTQLFRALQLAQRGDFAGAFGLLGPLCNNHTNAGRQAFAQSYRLRGEWMNLVGWIRNEVPPPVRRNDFALMPVYLRALGETGAQNELLLEFATILTSGGRAGEPAACYEANRRMALAFTGHLEVSDQQGSFQKLPRDLQEFWIATNQICAGNIGAGRNRLEQLRAATKDQLLLFEIDQRLDNAAMLGAARISTPSRALLSEIEKVDRHPPSAFGSGSLRPTPAVIAFIVINVVMFLLEMKLGGSTSPLTLHRLGALEPWAVRLRGEYWRMLTALFLHYGPLHLLFNLYALFVIGPGLERIIGSIRFATYYLLAGLGSSAGVLILRWSNRSPEQLVGASGCVMGIVGVWAGYLIRHRHEPFAGRRLRNIVLIIAIQSAFDLSTPQVSMAAHLSGLVTGLFLGLLISPRKETHAPDHDRAHGL